MRNPLRFLVILLFALAQFGCEGPEGPAGKDGEDGLPGPQGAAGPAGPTGPSSKARVIDFPATFPKTGNSAYQVGVGFAQNNITVGDKDIIMVYYFVGTMPDASNQQTPVWAPLPQTYYTAANTTPSTAANQPFTYAYVYSKVAAFIYVQGAQATKDALGDDDLKDQGFRLVVLPGSATGARMANGAKAPGPVDLNNYEAVAKYYQISEKDVIKMNIK